MGRKSPQAHMDAIFNMSNMGRGTARSFGIDIDFQPTPVILVAQFNKLGMDIRSFHEPLKRSVKDVMIPSIKKNFQEEGRPSHWEPLSQQWMYEKPKHPRTRFMDILQQHGDLKKVATQQNIWTINGIAGEALIKELPERVWYGMIHQEGLGGDPITKMRVKRVGKAPFSRAAGFKISASGAVQLQGISRSRTSNKGARTSLFDSVEGIPARPFLLIQERDKLKIEKVFEKWLQERFDANGWHSTRVVNV